jgi:hypothetical protein
VRKKQRLAAKIQRLDKLFSRVHRQKTLFFSACKPGLCHFVIGNFSHLAGLVRHFLEGVCHSGIFHGVKITKSHELNDEPKKVSGPPLPAARIPFNGKLSFPPSS